MSIATAAIGTPISRPNGLFPFTDKETGCLTEHGLQLLSQYYNFMVGMNRTTPCNATGKNVITLTPLDASPLIEKYVDYEVYSFVAEQTSDGSVTDCSSSGRIASNCKSLQDKRRGSGGRG
jgi:hypothetical protein